MCPFRRVEGEQAGPSALGVLVPPSHRTVLILRPRTLTWDLVLAQAGGGIREMNRVDAEQTAHQIVAARWKRRKPDRSSRSIRSIKASPGYASASGLMR